MIYKPSTAPGSFATFRGWMAVELERIAAAIAEPEPRSVQLAELTAAPAKVYDGLTVFADGTAWDPGAGRGVYTYYSGAWNRLG